VIVDMHCHLDLYPNPFEVAKQCQQKGIYVLSVTTTPKAWLGTLRLAEGSPRIRTALGLHPQLAHLRYQELDLFDEILPQARYVGEIGLDGGREYKEHLPVQLRVLRHILKSVDHAGGRIMSIHSLASAGMVLSELEKYPDAGVKVLHWFTGNKSELERAVNMGCWFSVGPAMLNSKRGSETTLGIPKDRLLPETDAPFALNKGKALMPWDAGIVTGQLAKLWNMSIQDVEAQLYENFKTLLHSNSN